MARMEKKKKKGKKYQILPVTELLAQSSALAYGMHAAMALRLPP